MRASHAPFLEAGARVARRKPRIGRRGEAPLSYPTENPSLLTHLCKGQLATRAAIASARGRHRERARNRKFQMP